MRTRSDYSRNREHGYPGNASRDELPVKSALLKALGIFIAITLISAFFISLLPHLEARPNLKMYLEKGCTEGINTYLWHILASLGIMLWGILMLYPANFIAKMTHELLTSVNTITSVMFGLIAGQAMYDLLSSPSGFWIKLFKFGFFGIIYILVFLFLTACIWAASYLPTQSRILERIEYMDKTIRMPGGILIFLLPVIFAFCLR